jgi:aminoglycoside phosphotransferase (APT) family kinase protein
VSNAKEEDISPNDEFTQIHKNLSNYQDLILRNHNITPIKITKLGGEGGANLKIDTKEQSFVLKITPYDGILQVGEYFYRRVREIDIPVPKVFELDRSKTVIPYEYILIEFIDGTTINNLDSKNHYEAGSLVGRIAKEFHKIVVDDFSPYIANYTSWDYAKWLERLDYYVTAQPETPQQLGLANEDIELIKNLSQSEQLLITQPNLLHGDLHYENALFTFQNNRLNLTALIDPNTTLGDPILDIAIAEVLSIKWNSPEFYNGLVEGYGGLSYQEEKRLHILRTLFCYWLTNWQSYENNDVSKLKKNLSSYLELVR